ncbi:GTPase IMAP family member 7-like isoform X1 [Labeo rohita]|uniref:GTPase IMAP family member 7-like isoform X1 n=1 Tax=Labeo rohita TaxID=84645 RepID=A0A498M8G3_LABRO|nr:GTPase IMAP family member 7-like isoform X1 [Labeo rohita]
MQKLRPVFPKPPRCFMVDKDMSEINALNAVFPESDVLLCWYHVLQAVVRWLMKSDSGVCGPHSSNTRREILDYFKKMKACAMKTDFDRVAKEFLKDFSHCQEVCKYFQRQQGKTLTSRISKPRYAVRIVLLGKSVSENSGVGNFILGRAAFDSEAPPDVAERVGGRLKNRHVIIINSPQLLQTNISDHQITQTVRECVNLSDPGPHVIVLLLRHDQCSTEDQKHVEKVLLSFSERVFQHTMVISTQKPTETNDIIQKIIQKCANRHFSLQRSSSPDDLLQAFEDIMQMNDGRHLVCTEASLYFTKEQQATGKRECDF